MTIRLGVIMDPLQQIKPWKDSTFAMLLAAQTRQWELFYMEPADLSLRDGKVLARPQKLTVADNRDNWFELHATKSIFISELDVVLMRQDPPVTMDYFHATYLLEMAERDGLMVVNKPGSVRDCNEKLFATWFPQCGPPTLVSRNDQELRDFVCEHKDTIFKPLDDMGGANIFRVKEGEPNISVIIEALTGKGSTQIMAQRFLPEIKRGDKRILMIDGEPIPYALARVPAKGETRGNLAAGGHGEGRELTERDRWICRQIGPTLREKSLLFVGIDVIGDYLTEINVTSPTCIRELDSIFNLDIAGQLMDVIEQKL